MRRELVIVPRERWGARPPRFRVKMRTPAPRVWVHHTVAAFPRSPTWRERTFKRAAYGYMRGIQDFHMNSRGWSDIAYSFVVFRGFFRRLWVFEGRGWGVVGAHTADDNSKSHGIAFAGNAEVEKVGRLVENTYVRLIKLGVRKKKIVRSPEVDGHYRAPGAATACPGKHLKARLVSIQSRVS